MQNSKPSEALTGEQILALDRRHIWHPYASVDGKQPLYPVRSAQGVEIHLADGRKLIDGMASWWCMIHGYNHPALNSAIQQQCQSMAHVMFGGLTHQPAVQLAETLVAIAPPGLERVFFADSGSVSVEVAIKMALQFWLSQGQPQKCRLLSFRNGYHGDTLGAMSVCDPVTGMHHLFSSLLPQQIFAESPPCDFTSACTRDQIAPLEQLLERHHAELAAVIIEPVVQGTGGMRFYSPDYLLKVRALCDRFQVLLITDEIATGFGRTGKMFACEHAGVSPDIMCVGKSLTGGYMTLAATLCTERVASGICEGEAGVFMHGPTFMANPLACAVALASIKLLLGSDWSGKVMQIGQQIALELQECQQITGVKSVRSLGAIGVVELEQTIDMQRMVPLLVDQGIWLRPFGTLLYTMPPFVISQEELTRLTSGMRNALANYSKLSAR